MSLYCIEFVNPLQQVGLAEAACYILDLTKLVSCGQRIFCFISYIELLWTQLKQENIVFSYTYLSQLPFFFLNTNTWNKFSESLPVDKLHLLKTGKMKKYKAKKTEKKEDSMDVL